MAISAIIAFTTASHDTESDEPTCDLFLVEDPTRDDPRGQQALRILSPTWTPPIGASIWGGASTVFIHCPGDSGDYAYTRVGYTRLREKAQR